MGGEAEDESDDDSAYAAAAGDANRVDDGEDDEVDSWDGEAELAGGGGDITGEWKMEAVVEAEAEAE